MHSHIVLFRTSLQTGLVLFAITCFTSFAIAGPSFYVTSASTSQGFLHYIDAEGNTTLVNSGPSAGRPMFPAVHEDRLYWSTYYPGKIIESGLLGQNPAIQVDQGHSTTRAIEFYDGSIYWNNEDLGAIYKSDLEFQNIQTVVSGHYTSQNGIWDFAIYDDRFYWTSWGAPNVKSTKLDGSDYMLITLPTVTRAFALEAYDGRLYVSDTISSRDARIVSVDLTGNDMQVLVEGPRTTTLDVYGDRLYFNDEGQLEIYSVPLAGGDWRVEAQTPRSPWQITVVPEPGTMGLALSGVFGSLLFFRRSARRLTAVRVRQ